MDLDILALECLRLAQNGSQSIGLLPSAMEITDRAYKYVKFIQSLNEPEKELMEEAA